MDLQGLIFFGSHTLCWTKIDWDHTAQPPLVFNTYYFQDQQGGVNLSLLVHEDPSLTVEQRPCNQSDGHYASSPQHLTSSQTAITTMQPNNRVHSSVQPSTVDEFQAPRQEKRKTAEAAEQKIKLSRTVSLTSDMPDSEELISSQMSNWSETSEGVNDKVKLN